MNLFIWLSVHIVLWCVDLCSHLFYNPLIPLFGPILSVILYLTGSQRCKIVREPIFISAFLSSTQTQVTWLLFHLICLSLHTSFLWFFLIFVPLSKAVNLTFSALCHWTLLSPSVIVLCGTPGVAHGYCRNGYKLHGFGVVSRKIHAHCKFDTNKRHVATALQAIHKPLPASSLFLVLGVSHSS